jgi:CHAT domain-containing protein
LHAALRIDKNNDHYDFLLDHTGGSQTGSYPSERTAETVALVSRWLWGKPDENDAIKMGLTNFKQVMNGFPSQRNKMMLNALGNFIHNNLLPKNIAYSLINSKIDSLSLKVDDSLADIPWELINDGSDFLCMKYSIGRTYELITQNYSTISDKEVRVILIDDPTDSLPASKNEINYLLVSLLNLPRVKTRRYGKEMRKKDFLNTLRDGNFDILHFSGHGSFDSNRPDNSRLLFYDYDNPCYAHEIADNLGNKSHALVFSNACSSAKTILGQKGLVQAFLSNGTSAYIGTMWPVQDQIAGMIGEEFYRYIVHGSTIGEALRLAKLNSYRKFTWSSLSWAAFILYGNPEQKIFSPGKL